MATLRDGKLVQLTWGPCGSWSSWRSNHPPPTSAQSAPEPDGTPDPKTELTVWHLAAPRRPRWREWRESSLDLRQAEERPWKGSWVWSAYLVSGVCCHLVQKLEFRYSAEMKTCDQTVILGCSMAKFKCDFVDLFLHFLHCKVHLLQPSDLWNRHTYTQPCEILSLLYSILLLSNKNNLDPDYRSDQRLISSELDVLHGLFCVTFEGSPHVVVSPKTCTSGCVWVCALD